MLPQLLVLLRQKVAAVAVAAASASAGEGIANIPEAFGAVNSVAKTEGIYNVILCTTAEQYGTYSPTLSSVVNKFSAHATASKTRHLSSSFFSCFKKTDNSDMPSKVCLTFSPKKYVRYFTLGRLGCWPSSRSSSPPPCSYHCPPLLPHPSSAYNTLALR